MWIQPGGHIDPGELPLEAAQREAEEETGVVASFDKKLFHIDVHDAGDHMHYDLRFLGQAHSINIKPQEGESQNVAWFSPAALSSIEDPALMGCINKLLNAYFV